MKFTQKWKNFWNIQKHTTGGFTLVELIVVIAILAILAGVAVPVYSGYVEKAERAADEQLLVAVNKAFASACISEGNDVYNVTGAELEWAGKAITGIESIVDVADVSGYDEAFVMFYDGNETAEFKVIETLVFDNLRKMFVDPMTVGDMHLAYGGGVIKINSAALALLNDSIFIQDMGVEELLGQVNTVTDVASTLFGDKNQYMMKVLSDPDFLASAAEALDTDLNGLNGKVRGLAEQMVDPSLTKGTTEYEAAIADAINKVQANAAVLYAAEKTQNMSVEQIKNLLGGEKTGDTISDTVLTGNAGDGLAQAAVAYGMYTAYYNSGNYKGELEGDEINDIGTVMDCLDDEDFKAFINSGDADKDIEAYKSSLDMVHSSTESTPAVETLMVNGYSDPNLVALLQNLLNKQ